MEKRWLTVGDDRVSDGCKDNQRAGWIALNDAFPSGDDRPLRFPGCRCVVQYRRKAGVNTATQATAKDYNEALPVTRFDTGEAANKYFKKTSPHGKLKAKERNALTYYQSLGYARINDHLRGLDVLEGDALTSIQANIDLLDKSLANAALKDNTETYRGMLIEPDNAAGKKLLRQLKPGFTYKDEGYVSTTVAREVAEGFGGGENVDSEVTNVMMIIRAPQGTPAIYTPVANPDQLSREYELLLARGLTYRVLSRKVTDGLVTLEVEIVL
jgi:hypothetical protein